MFTGNNAGYYNSSGSSNVFIGYAAGYNNSTASTNTFVGDYSGFSNKVGASNVFIGTESGRSNEVGGQNTFLGYYAGYSTNASANTFIGYQAGRSNTSGQFNTFMGVNAGISNTNGNSNFMLGTNAGNNNTSGTANFFVGDNAGGANTTGGFNVFLGTNAGASNTVGNNNTAIGFEANVESGALVNATAIGFRAVVSASNSLVLGNSANVGIGTSSPSSKLHLVTGTANQSGLRLENLTSNSPASATGQTKFLTVDGSGNVVLGSTTSGGRISADLWQRNGTYLQSIDDNAVIIGQGISKTPNDYNLFVSKGILTEKVKVAVKNASEWSDYVFAPGYTLTPLAEVEQHIKQKGHLPGLPSASEVVEQGVDVAKMDAKLLEKIEELTLYSIQLEKENKQQRQLNQQQNNRIDELEKLVKQLIERK
ncbi:bZIP transcription factor [Spirosoma sp. KUDC1026]|uniref:bZIP transcription factor n=1 Tax=Spirosoma sp. KUDC1026 TaxID=2745947 RepID=UPI001E5C741B|nr:bZIP transcription factor [Spirosoma sp. KUDC1026]